MNWTIDFNRVVIVLHPLVANENNFMRELANQPIDHKLLISTQEMKDLCSASQWHEDSQLLIDSPPSLPLLVHRQLETNPVVVVATSIESFHPLLVGWAMMRKEGLQELKLYLLTDNTLTYYVPHPRMLPYETISTPLALVRQGTLLLTFIVDNSLFMESTLYQSFIINLKQFCSRLFVSFDSSIVDFQVVAFGDGQPSMIKTFGQNEFHEEKLYQGGMPLLKPILEEVLQLLDKKEKTVLSRYPNSLYKSWVVLFTNHTLFDQPEELLASLIQVFENGERILLPFILHQPSPEGVLNQIKTLPMMRKPNVYVLKQHQFDRMFNFLYEFALRRVQTPLEDKLKLLQKDIEGWVTL